MDIKTFLGNRGFQQIQLEKNAVGHLMLTINYDSKAFKVIVDTGASTTVLDIDLVRSLGFTAEKLDFSGGGLGTAQADVYQLPQRPFLIQDLPLGERQVIAMDIQYVNQALEGRDAEKVDGVLGSDILVSHHAIIDCKDNHLYLKLK
ncbi:aspartyl protease family protein [Candidatus Leptofilum sp.]|uniref:aspartyl protease family protein n=1 Tax=Candidatus Leptofilum sp. TaxID=3241576 RepID=UPI003B59E08C